MKFINHHLMRRAQSVLATGLLLGGMVAASAQTLSLPPQTNQFRMASNYVSGTLAPYNTNGGGVPAQSFIYQPVYTNNTCTLNWYGTYGWYTVQGATNVLGPWVNLTNVYSTNFACQAVLNTTNSSYSFFQLAQANSYAGSGACSGCHSTKYNGYIKTMHSSVYSNPSAVANFTTNCLTVGYQQPTGFTDPINTPYLENVGCENCHGPAGWHRDSDHAIILPVVSQDPAICGSCHQGPLHPTFQEYTNLDVAAMGLLTSGRSHSAGSHTGACQVCHQANQRMDMVKEYYDNLAGSPHALSLFPSQFGGAMGSAGAAACATCHDPHSSNNVAQLRYPISSTNYNQVVPLLNTATVLTTNYNWFFITNAAVIVSTNFSYSTNLSLIGTNVVSTNTTVTNLVFVTNAPVVVGTKYSYVTNANSVGGVSTNTTYQANIVVLYTNVSSATVTWNTVFDQYFNPKVQVCGQCHSGGGGIGGAGPRWDGETYGFVTNLVTSSVTNQATVSILATNTVTQISTNTYYVDVTTNASGVVQVFTNAVVYTNGTVQVYDNQGNLYTNGLVSVTTNSVPVWTNTYTYIYTVSQYQTNVVTTSTNPVVTVGLYYPLIAYTNGGTVYYATNSAGDYAPHYPVQYNVLIGQLNDNLAASGGPPNVLTDAHTLSPNQCADCHVPSYPVVAGVTNVTGHSFICDYNSPGCVASSCHASYAGNSSGLAAHTLTYKQSVSNSIVRVVSLLKQWGLDVALPILQTNYGTCAWEYPSPSAYFGAKSTNTISGLFTNKAFLTGPPKAWNGIGLPSGPTGTNDDVQLNNVPQDIRMARFSLYWIYEDESMGVHNPTYTSNLLAWAENDVITNQFIAAGWPTFSANVLAGTHPLQVQFSNTGSGSVYSWTFGDAGTAAAANPSHTYNNPGLYSVTCTVDGRSLTRTNYILVQ